MTLPQWYHTKGDTRVCKLNKYLYGLKYASRKWNEKLCFALFCYAFRQSINDYSFIVKFENDIIIVFLLCVEDIILTSNNNV